MHCFIKSLARLTGLLSVTGVLLTLVACGDPDPRAIGACSSDESCEGGLCFSGECYKPCSAQDQCGADEFCVQKIDGAQTGEVCVVASMYAGCATDEGCAPLVVRGCESSRCDLALGLCVVDRQADELPCANGDGEPGVCDSGACRVGECSPGCVDEAGDDIACGDDGCGGSCGTCDEGFHCEAGDCVEDPCAPDCDGRVCGDDGCGSSCGACRNDCTGVDDDPELCEDGICVQTCCPDCTGRACGDDGCGGLCGACAEGFHCDSGDCVEDPCVPSCDDGEGGTMDCGDNGCGGSCGACPNDCDGVEDDPELCFEGVCMQTCCPLCDARVCGDDGCGGICGQCGLNETCTVEGTCEPICVVDCTDKDCGADGCGGSCGDCPEAEACSALGVCEPACVADCTDKDCGDDGCGGECGDCDSDETCTLSGLCAPSCVPDCTDKDCGDDGCGATCGDCDNGETCTLSGLCAPNCVPDCTDKSCGDDGCGSTCGDCDNGEECNELGRCELPCVPDCTDKLCGDDGCGGSCGDCTANEECTADGLCELPCAPDCTDKLCGDDGCGGSCGDCADAELCTGSGACVSEIDCWALNLCLATCGAEDEACDGACRERAALATQDLYDAYRDCDDIMCGDISPPACQALRAANCQTTFDACQDASCVPDCEFKTCGDDGCGGSCGECEAGQICDGDQQCYTQMTCGELSSCVGPCAPDDIDCSEPCYEDASPEAIALYEVLLACYDSVDCFEIPPQQCAEAKLAYCQDDYDACKDAP